jgi:uncharacterized membrane protein
MGTGHADLDRFLADDDRFHAHWLVATVVSLALLTAGGLAWLWPRNPPTVDLGEFGFASAVVRAEVTDAVDGPCSFAPDLDCHRVTFQIKEGADAGSIATQEFDVSTSAPRFAPGDGVVLNVVPEADPRFRYQYADRDRRAVLIGLGMLFALAVVGLGRLRGVAALVGLAASVAVLVAFIAPAILVGHSPVLVAAVGGSAIALLTLYLAHGWSPLTHVAVIGTYTSLALTLALSSAFSALARFSGFGSEEAFFLTFVEGVEIRGLILAGAVLGAIGALDDVTVTQASAVFELRRLSPSAPSGVLFASGLKVGRDHIASTVNTLLLAYAGASMPLLLLFTLSELPLGVIANSEVVATEIFRTLVGSIGLVASVPLTTWLAAQAAGRQR